MKKHLSFWGGVAVVAIIGFVSCDFEPSYENNWLFVNQSSFTIQVNITTNDVHPSSFTLRPGGERNVGSNTASGTIWFNWSRTDTGTQAGVVFVDEPGRAGGTFRNQ